VAQSPANASDSNVDDKRGEFHGPPEFAFQKGPAPAQWREKPATSAS
jgi:hypothetical protein